MPNQIWGRICIKSINSGKQIIHPYDRVTTTRVMPPNPMIWKAAKQYQKGSYTPLTCPPPTPTDGGTIATPHLLPLTRAIIAFKTSILHTVKRPRFKLACRLI
jgi:hypothetical protein